MARYGKKASEKVEAAMQDRKEGMLRSGRTGKKVKSRKQAIAIALSENRVPGAASARYHLAAPRKAAMQKRGSR